MPMFLSIHVSDDTLARLTTQAAAAGHGDPSRSAADALKAGAQLPPGRVVHLAGDPLDQLEHVLQGGSILNGQDLLDKVQRLAGISMMHVRFPFTPGQLEDLVVRAERQGLTVEELVDRAAGRIYEQFFNLIRQ